MALQCAAGTDRLLRPHLQRRLPTAHAEPAPGEHEPGCTLSLGLPGPGFRSADLLSAKDKQFHSPNAKDVPIDYLNLSIATKYYVAVHLISTVRKQVAP